jgi:hypothetical protein
MRGRRLPLDPIPQWEPETVPLDHDLIPFIQNKAVRIARNAAAQKMDMHVARNPVCLEFKMTLLDLLQPERGVFFAGPDFLRPYGHSVPFHGNRSSDVLKLSVERQLRPNRARPQLGAREQASILRRNGRIREFVSRSESHAPRGAIGPIR